MPETNMIDVGLDTIILHDGDDRQYIYLSEMGGQRRFPIVIGHNEAGEIYRVVHSSDTPRPLTHQLTYNLLNALGAKLMHVDIVALQHNTFFAQISLENADGNSVSTVDARPSDAIALALRAGCRIRVDEAVLEQARKDVSPPELPPPSEPDEGTGSDDAGPPSEDLP